MVFITCMTEEDVRKLIDVDYIQKQLAGLKEKTTIVYVCVNDDWSKDDTWSEDGKKFYRIVMDYQKVKAMPPAKVRALMLRLAEERLGLVKEI